MDEEKIRSLHDEIISKVAEYYKLTHKKKASSPFVPGSSKINYAGRFFDEKEMEYLTDATLDFWLTYGRFCAKFEEGLGKFLGVKNVFFVNSGSSANLLAFMALASPLLGERRILRGDEVITVAAGFPTTVSPVIQYGAVPVFVDVDPSTAGIDVSMLEKAYSAKTKAVMLAHTLGNPFDVKAVKAFCKKYSLFLVEDNCDSLGSTVDGRFTGTFGDIGTSSFYPPHHMTTGEGGAAYTDDPLLAKIIRSLRDWGRDCSCPPGVDNSCGCRFSKQFGRLPSGYDHKYAYSHFGYNLKATDLQAAVGCAQLEKLPMFIAGRKANFKYLYEHLKDIPELELQSPCPGGEPSWFGFLMTVSRDAPFTRNELAEHLEKMKIQTRNLFAGNLLRHPCFDGLIEDVDYRVCGTLENTDRFMNDALWIGVYPGMTEEKLEYMVSAVRGFIDSKRAHLA